MSIENGICDICGSDRGGFVCGCGETRCICERKECPTCNQRREFEEEKAKFEAEQDEREDFENRMEEKYH